MEIKKFQVGDKVSVILNERNSTSHVGTIRESIWHHKDECWNYYLEENGRKVSKRYLKDDLQPG